MVRLPTNTEAIDYVIRTEASWNLVSEIKLVTPADGEYVRVVTAANDWAVWVEPDGSIYGEC
jgi:hypothetical protein